MNLFTTEVMLSIAPGEGKVEVTLHVRASALDKGPDPKPSSLHSTSSPDSQHVPRCIEWPLCHETCTGSTCPHSPEAY